MPLTMVSSGSVTSLTASSAFSPLAGDDDVDHGHGDLRLLLARQGHERDQAERQRGDQQQRRQRRGDEGAGQGAGEAERRAPAGCSSDGRSWDANLVAGLESGENFDLIGLRGFGENDGDVERTPSGRATWT